jgi:hypothetical protein
MVKQRTGADGIAVTAAIFLFLSTADITKSMTL